MIDGKKIIDSSHGQFAWVNGDGDLADGFEGGAGLAGRQLHAPRSRPRR